jgi:hypothetical protein
VGPQRPPPESNTNATRHLSAGAYLDPQFCLTALREVYYQTKRIVAPSYGFDSIAVLGHCLRARRAMVVRDALLVGLLLLGSWLSLIAMLIMLCMLLTVHIVHISIRVIREAIDYVMEGGYFRDSVASEQATHAGGAGRMPPGRTSAASRPPRRFVRLWFENVVAQIAARTIGIVGTYVMLLAGTVLLAARLWHTEPLGRTRLGIPLWHAVACFAGLAFFVPAATRAWNRIQLYALVPDRSRGRPVATRRLSEIDRQISGNTVVYSGYRQFVGAGEVLLSWSIAQRLVRTVPRVHGLLDPPTEADREFETPPFTARQLRDHVRRYIRELAADTIPERRLSNLTVDDRVFVAGTEIRDLWVDAPDELVDRIITDPRAPARHYLQCQVVSWHGELVTTVYVHFAVQGKALYVELKVLGLAPCRGRYRIVDQVGGTSLARLLGDAGRAMFAAPVLLVAAPRGLVRAAADLVTVSLAGLTTNKRVKKGYDYGAKMSLREWGASEVARDPMQSQDIVKYGRVVERRVLAAILDFLEDRGVDITELRQRSQTILNAGAVATSGGTVNVGGDAVGIQSNTTTEGSE